ncbi:MULTISPECIES: hypothetical protein [unclassified Mucilaginibacter]|uniref:hypothetical protein n=1 Tax=unclassified Mucilaginibacter TaxID=2617802 RepID=UPI002AC8E912|nr:MULTISPECIES: hypothetical protein [unclassified Mucilaginibacter]MEB0248594.1 hypothetical protein [Mucilaginibacter sp. 5B2]MEB0262003.1 hypothetical protein [Mucilaginibacter sp. 10I4]MEB0279733.1 hypothetical protein [Mucilaginibacter sp. 10B2]MEB0301674.1 hypothetical protein [Mucilaginibacter sp. 5C4]WPX23708.1 hypothetical protein RHM67_00240 [Mucilaginibacter sp. 5C4]
MLTLEEIYAQDPNQKVIDEGAGWGAEQMLKAGVPIFYRDEQYPETMQGNLFVKEFTSGAKFIVKKELTDDLRLLEETIRQLNAL